MVPVRHVLQWGVAGCYVVWFLLSIAVLVPKFMPYIRAMDGFLLVPGWKFFAPNPVQGDYHLLYRDQLADGTVTEWTEVTLFQRRRWWNVAWNPGKRANKALFDAIQDLSDEARRNPGTLVGSISYLTLLNYVSSVERFAPPAFTQFMLLHSFSLFLEREPQLVFSSELHSL